MLLARLGDCHIIALLACALLCLGHALMLCSPKGLAPALEARQPHRVGTGTSGCSAICSYRWCVRLPTSCSSWEAPSVQPHPRRTWHRHCCALSLSMAPSQALQSKCALVVYSIKAQTSVIKVTEHATELNMSYEMF